MKNTTIPVLLPRKAKKRLTAWLYDKAEALPEFQKGPLTWLQMIRKHQREEAERTFKQTSIPDGINFSLISLRLFEVFELTDSAALQKGIFSLFPTSNSPHLLKSLKEDFPRYHQSIFSGHWQVLGTINQPKRNILTSLPVRRFELPQEVDFITVSAQKITPSLMAVSFDVCLKPEVTDKILEFQKSKPLPEGEIDYIYLPVFQFGYSSNPSERVLTEKIEDYLEGVRIKVEELLYPYFKGYFFKASVHKGRAKLPAFEVYSLRANDLANKTFESWAHDNRFWLSIFGFLALDLGYYNQDYLLYLTADFHNRRGRVHPFKVVLFDEPKEGNGKKEEQKKNPGYTMYTIQGFLESLLSPLAFNLMQSVELSKIEKLRESVVQNIDRGMSRQDISKEIRGYSRLSHALRFIEGLKLEYEQTKDLMVRNITTGDCTDFVTVRTRKGIEERRKFSDDITSRIEGVNTILYNHLTYLEKHFSNRVNLLNTDAVYKLQAFTAFLTIGALIIGLISIFAQWKELIEVSYLLNAIFRQVLGG